MKVFIASHSQELASKLRDLILGRGHECTARWIVEDTRFHAGHGAYSDEERARLALMDAEDVAAADVLVLIAEEEGRTVPGGKHVETGMALAAGRPVVVWGRRENVFHWHPLVTVVKSPHEVIALIDRIAQNGATHSPE
ncbi:MAG TPA: hypothetical protein PKY77_07660 [Phycisphaerae bacterium]|nr:hypothetical protein [Phycisphaerae bacterium]HRY67877.1 hypothetical protein [Phycisphaerae bacterium]HSA25331.1 hypothetical protein [Phycisphaerae bacterium]